MFDPTWLYWAPVLIAQNFAFTFVSRARNSGSLQRHLIAGIASNGIWFISQIIIFSKMFKMMTGDYGVAAAIGTATYYTAFTLVGSLVAHYWSLKNEKGKAAVGASNKYVQISTDEWNEIKRKVGV
jgi:hypothetical protein